MKWAFCLLAATIGMIPWLSAREFTSADGQQKMEAEFIRYDIGRDRVTLRLSSGRNLVVSSKHFTDPDQAYFKQQQLLEDKKTALSIKTDRDSEREKNFRGQMVYKYKNTKFSFEVRNSSESELENLTFKYWVLVERDKKTEDSDGYQTFKGEKSIDRLYPNSEQTIDGPSVKLTQGAAATCACPKIEAIAATIGRDRIIGSKVEISDRSGEVLYSDTSSMRMDVLLNQ